MKTITVKINLYSYDELNEKAQGKAVDDLITFYLEYIPYEHMSRNMKKACNEANARQTPWFTKEYVWDYCKRALIAELRRGDYLESGKLYLVPEDQEQAA